MRDFTLEDAIWKSQLPHTWKLLLAAMAFRGERICEKPATLAARISRSKRYVQKLQREIAATGILVRIGGGGSCMSPEGKREGYHATWKIDPAALGRVNDCALFGCRGRVHGSPSKGEPIAQNSAPIARKGARSVDFLHANQQVELYKQLKPMRAPAHTREGSLCPGLDPWEAIKATLQKAMDPHTFSTWFRPSRFSHTTRDTAFVVLPTPTFVQVVQKFESELQRALADSCVDLARVQFVPAEQGRGAA